MTLTQRIPWEIFPDPHEACDLLAEEVAHLIRCRAVERRAVVLGLATGSTPLPFYEALIRLHREGLSFSNVITFNLDEYLGLNAHHPQSYHSFMWSHLIAHLDMLPENFHIPDGEIPEADIDTHCEAYEARITEAGGIDFQILGIGRTGHIGFNEPGSSIRSRTRPVHLDPVTRQDAAANFGGLEHVPKRAITMGCGTILEAKRIALLAWGEAKASIVERALHGPVTDELPASYLQTHPNCGFYLDPFAGAFLETGRSLSSGASAS
jgi:glucosamine-6-phosphate deaminase